MFFLLLFRICSDVIIAGDFFIKHFTQNKICIYNLSNILLFVFFLSGNFFEGLLLWLQYCRILSTREAKNFAFGSLVGILR